MRDFGIPDDAAHVNPNGGVIALGQTLNLTEFLVGIVVGTAQQQRVDLSPIEDSELITRQEAKMENCLCVRRGRHGA